MTSNLSLVFNQPAKELKMSIAPKLLVLDDYEGELAAAPAMERLRQLANVTILDHPLEDYTTLKDFQFILALRERTKLSQTPNGTSNMHPRPARADETRRALLRRLPLARTRPANGRTRLPC